MVQTSRVQQAGWSGGLGDQKLGVGHVKPCFSFSSGRASSSVQQEF